MEASSQVHLGIMHIGTVLQQGDTHACRELGRQRLLVKRGTGNLLSDLTNQQREGILRSTYLTAEVVGLRLVREISSLGTLHIGRAHTA